MSKNKADFNNPEYKKVLKSAFKRNNESKEDHVNEKASAEESGKTKKKKSFLGGVDSIFSNGAKKNKIMKKTGKDTREDEIYEPIWEYCWLQRTCCIF